VATERRTQRQGAGGGHSRRVTDTTKVFNELLNPFLDRLEQL